MPVKKITASIAIALAASTASAAPTMWPSAPSSQQVVANDAPRKQGFWHKLLFGEQTDAPQVAQNVFGQPRVAQSPPTGWNPLSSRTASAVQNAPAHAEPNVTAQSFETSKLLQQAKAAETSGDVSTARRQFAAALAQNPTDVATLREIGHFEDRLGNLTVAEGVYRRAAATAPGDASVLNDLALCCARQNRLQESVQLLSQAIQIRPDKPLYRNNIAKVLVELGQPNAALTHLTAAHAPTVAHYNMGCLLLEKDPAAAKEHLVQATSIDPSFAPAAQALAKLDPSENSILVSTTKPAEQRAIAAAGEAEEDPTVTPDAVDSETEEVEFAQHNGPRLLPPIQ